jgi:hypothetical protein
MEMRSDILSEKGPHKSGAVAALSLEFCFISLGLSHLPLCTKVPSY